MKNILSKFFDTNPTWTFIIAWGALTLSIFCLIGNAYAETKPVPYDFQSAPMTFSECLLFINNAPTEGAKVNLTLHQPEIVHQDIQKELLIINFPMDMIDTAGKELTGMSQIICTHGTIYKTQFHYPELKIELEL